MHRLTMTMLAAGLALIAGQAAAQNTTAAPPPPVVPTQSAPAPTLVPGAGNFSLPGAVAVPEAPKPAVETPAPAPQKAEPTKAKPAAAKPAEPKPIPAQPAPASVEPKTPVEPTAPVVAAPVPAPPPVVAPVAETTMPWWLYALGGLVVLASLAALLLRRRAPDAEAGEPVTEPTPAPIPVRATGPATPWLKLEIRPIRAGPTATGAAAEFELVLRNAGQATAERVSVEAALFSTGEWQEELVSAFQDAPATRPLVPAFDLPGGEERRLTATAIMAPDAVEAVDFRGRPMFVPILSVKASYVFAAGRPGLAAETRILGVEKPGEARIGPFWLDRPRMESAVGARPFVPRPLAGAAVPSLQ